MLSAGSRPPRPANSVNRVPAGPPLGPFAGGALPLSETWISNRTRNPEIALRNADDLYVPAHHFATTKISTVYYAQSLE
jgi:hypothetical protein